MKIGYVRVSKHEQNEALQIDALKASGCEKWFIDKVTGSKAERKGLSEALPYLRSGDTFIVWKLDRAGRSLKHLIELLKVLQERDIAFVSLTEQIDTTTPGGKLIFHLMGLWQNSSGILFVSGQTQGSPQPKQEDVSADGHESSKPTEKSLLLGRCSLTRVTPFQKSVLILESPVPHCIGM
jgi:hypothetical protein